MLTEFIMTDLGGSVSARQRMAQRVYGRTVEQEQDKTALQSTGSRSWSLHPSLLL